MDGCDSRVRWHPFGWNDHNLAAFVQNQLAEVVEHVIDFRMREIAMFDLTGRWVDAAGDVALRFDQ